MATFIALTRDLGETVHINMDKVVMIFQHDKSTVLAFESNYLVNVTVKETPSQIYDLTARRKIARKVKARRGHSFPFRLPPSLLGRHIQAADA
jgi:hypothetical protein